MKIYYVVQTITEPGYSTYCISSFLCYCLFYEEEELFFLDLTSFSA